MTEQEPQTVPEADPAAVRAIAAELAIRQTKREAAAADRRARKKAEQYARMAELTARSAANAGLRREQREALKAERAIERAELRARKKQELDELRAQLKAIPRPDKKRGPALSVRMPAWSSKELYAVVRAVLALCSEQERAYDLARALQDAVIEAYPMTPAEMGTGYKGRHDLHWTTPIVIGPQPPDQDPEG